jgi:hypothetical protein
MLEKYLSNFRHSVLKQAARFTLSCRLQMKNFLYFAIVTDLKNPPPPKKTTYNLNNGRENVFSNVVRPHSYLSTGGHGRESNIPASCLEKRDSDVDVLDDHIFLPRPRPLQLSNPSVLQCYICLASATYRE